MDDDGHSPSSRPRALWQLGLFGLIGLSGVLLLTGLGVWQLERRVWKLDLIQRVEQRVHAPAVPAPGPSQWPGIDDGESYRHVEISGHFRAGRDTLVKAVTERGSGSWVISPFQTDEGFTVLINRGFVPDDAAQDSWQVSDVTAQAVTGLLRMTEPGGGFLRRNDPAAGRWYSRDVAAIAAARALGTVAPYFIDRDAGANAQDLPVSGLTIIRFPNNHLVYALTWFGLALMLIAAMLYVGRYECRMRRSMRFDKAGSASHTKTTHDQGMQA